MIDDVTLGVGSAITRINARTVHACVISGALAVRHALRHDIGCNRKYHLMIKEIITNI